MSPTNQQLSQITDALQKAVSHDHCTRQSLASFRLTLTSP
jgi:hypothetical protein